MTERKTKPKGSLQCQEQELHTKGDQALGRSTISISICPTVGDKWHASVYSEPSSINVLHEEIGLGQKD